MIRRTNNHRFQSPISGGSDPWSPWILGGIVLCLILLIWQRIELEGAKSQARAMIEKADALEKKLMRATGR